MSLHVITLGYSQTSTSASESYNSYTQPSGQGSVLLQNLGANAIAIGGRQFVVDTSFEPYRREAFRHRSLPAQRESVNFTNIMGEATVNTEGLWRRGQNDWSAGAGQKYLDRKDSQMPHRFYSSKGVDVFSQDMQMTLLNDTTQVRSSTNTNLQICRAGGYMFIIDGTSILRTPVTGTGAYSTYTTLTNPTGVTAYYSLCSNDSRVFFATDKGIWYYDISQVGGGSPLTLAQWCGNDSGTGFTGFNLVRYCNERLIAASGNYLYSFAYNHSTPSSTAPGAATDLLMVHTNVSWVWTDAVGGPSQIYFAGYVQYSTGAKGFSAIYRSGIPSSTANSAAVPNFPVQALPLPGGEQAYSLACYLNYVFIGTSKGIRMAQTLSAYDPNATQTGDLKSGSYIPNLTNPVGYPVKDIVGDGRFVYFGWSNYDTASTGLGKLDLTTNIAGDPLTPAYASDLMVSGQGEVISMDWDTYNGYPVFAISGKGFYRKDLTKYVTQGTLNSGGFTYGIPDHKIPVFFDYGVAFPANNGTQVSANLVTEPFDANVTGTISVPAATTELFSEKYLAAGSAYTAETFEVQLNLLSDTTQTQTPTVFRWTLKSWPKVVSEVGIMVPVQLFSVNVVDGMEVFTDPYEAYMYLENLRYTQQITTYQEGSLTASVIVEDLDFLPHKRRGGYESGFEGDCVVTLKTIGGYNSYSGIPTT